jgi:hypothetical protein
MYWVGEDDVHISFWWGELREGHHLENPDKEGRIILQLICKTWDGRVWTGLMSLDRDRWRAPVNMV